MEKSSDCAEDAEIRELCGSVPLHAVRCPVHYTVAPATFNCIFSQKKNVGQIVVGWLRTCVISDLFLIVMWLVSQLAIVIISESKNDI